MIEAESIFVSDTHLFHPLNGAMKYQASMIEAANASHIYLVGDIIDFEKIIRNLKRALEDEGRTNFRHMKFPQVIREIQFPQMEFHLRYLDMLFAKMQQGAKITYITGNHDPLKSLHGKTVQGMQVKENALQKMGELLFHIEHGHENDPDWILRNPASYKFGSILLDGGMKLDHLLLKNIFNPLSRNLRCVIPQAAALEDAYFITNMFKTIGKFYIGNFREKSTQRARMQGADGEICGHIHKYDHALIMEKLPLSPDFDAAVQGAETAHLLRHEINLMHSPMRYINTGDGFNHGTALVYKNEPGFGIDGFLHLTRRDAPLSNSFTPGHENPYIAHRQQTLKFLETMWQSCLDTLYKRLPLSSHDTFPSPQVRQNSSQKPRYEAA